jgi:hypothetical protein
MRIILTIVVAIFWIVVGLIVLRFCAWADTGMKGNVPIERSIIP